MSKAHKVKGDKYERELAAHINDATGLNSSRAPLSGGGKVGMHGTADLIGTPALFIEAKRVERLNFHDAMRQAEITSRSSPSGRAKGTPCQPSTTCGPEAPSPAINRPPDS